MRPPHHLPNYLFILIRVFDGCRRVQTQSYHISWDLSSLWSYYVRLLYHLQMASRFPGQHELFYLQTEFTFG